ncbi:MAG: hypothetical protein J6C55_01490, partial [Oscillospiraceae bacterium]|nr:hypothetical protein [Oscillospiraceae bacterium]
FGSGYPVHVWSERVAYVLGSGDQTEAVKREYVYPVEKYKLSEKIKIGEKELKFDWKNSSGGTVTEVNTKSGSVTVYGPEKILKIPVRVKINYDPSNNLEKWVRDHVRHDFFRKSTGGWDRMTEDTEYLYSIYTVPNSIKIGVDGTKTQDFIFSYYIFKAKDKDSKDYKFGFNKSYINVKDDSSNYGMKDGNAFMTYMKQDVGGGKKLFVDYDIDPKQILENYENYNSGS